MKLASVPTEERLRQAHWLRDLQRAAWQRCDDHRLRVNNRPVQAIEDLPRGQAFRSDLFGRNNVRIFAALGLQE
jgi:hypothetical protein